MALVTQSKAQGIEQPQYTVIKQVDGVELRNYAPYIVAEVTVEANNQGQASSMGFRLLAGYIFGGNKGSDKIAMTAPVTTQAPTSGTKIDMTAPVTTSLNRSGAYTIRFSMPSKWTMDTLPLPNDDQVKLIEVGAEKRVVYQFTGNRTQDDIDKAAAKLAAFWKSESLKPVSPIINAGYDGPSVPADKRRWEVMQVVE